MFKFVDGCNPFYTFKFKALLVALFLIGLTFSAAYAANNRADVECLMLRGSSTLLNPPVRDGGAFNEGVFNFGVVNEEYRACITDLHIPDADRFILQGWVWNTNLGWVSLASASKPYIDSYGLLPDLLRGSFDDGRQLYNMGIRNGTRHYSSQAFIKGTDESGLRFGDLGGYWWGDNTGWIRLNCSPYYDSDQNICNRSNFKVSFRETGPGSGIATLSGYAWSGSSGWVNFQGVSMPLPNSFAQLRAEINISGGSNIYANGQDVRNIGVDLYSGNNRATSQLWNYLQANDEAKLCFLFRDNRVLDVTVDNPPLLGDMSECDEVRFNRYGSNLTERFDLLDIQGRQSLLVFRSLTSEVPAADADLQLIGLRLESAGGAQDLILPNPISLEFKDPLEVNLKLNVQALSSEECFMADNNFLKIVVGVPIGLNLCGQFKAGAVSTPRVEVSFEGGDNNNLLSYGFANIANNNESNPYVVTNFRDLYRNNLFNAFVELNQDEVEVQGDFQNLIKNLTLKMVKQYRTAEGLVVKRLGAVQSESFVRTDTVGGSGGLISRGFTSLSGDDSGAASVKKVNIRDEFVKSVYEVVQQNSNVVERCKFERNVEVALFRQVFPLCKISDRENVYYINNTQSQSMLLKYDDIRWLFEDSKERRTVVFVGFDIYFGSDILYNDGNGNPPGLILFKNKNGVGGNIYVSKDVVELYAGVFADRTIYSVDSFEAINNKRNSFGVPTRPRVDFSQYYNEIVFVGSFFSENCVGCALENPPKKGDGTIASSFFEASLYDLSYFRFSSLMYRIVKVEDEDDPEFVDEYLLNCDGTLGRLYREGFGIPDQYYCWVNEGEKRSPYLKRFDELRSAESLDFHRKAVNFMQGKLEGLPLFDK